MGGIKLVIDNREQKPLVFKSESIRGTLGVGDYGCLLTDGSMHQVIFERKGIGDLFGTLSKGYERFKKEIIRSIEQGIVLVIVIEGSKERVLRGYSQSQRNGCSIVLQLETIRERYGIQHIYFKSRKSMANHIEDFYLTQGPK